MAGLRQIQLADDIIQFDSDGLPCVSTMELSAFNSPVLELEVLVNVVDGETDESPVCVVCPHVCCECGRLHELLISQKYRETCYF